MWIQYVALFGGIWCVVVHILTMTLHLNPRKRSFYIAHVIGSSTMLLTSMIIFNIGSLVIEIFFIVVSLWGLYQVLYGKWRDK